VKKLALFSTCIALGAAIAFEGSFLHLLLLMAAMFYLIIPSSLIMGIWTAVAARRQTWRPWYSTFWRCAGIFAFSVLLSGLAGYGLHEWRVRQTRDYVSRAVVVLDDLHARTGQYPSTFPIDAVGTPPKWLRSSQSCTVSAQDFRFEYWDPAGMMDGYEFNSATRTWTYFD
jgi:hypothetical protein